MQLLNWPGTPTRDDPPFPIHTPMIDQGVVFALCMGCFMMGCLLGAFICVVAYHERTKR